MKGELLTVRFLNNLKEELFACLFPSFCLGCTREGDIICDICISKIPCTGIFCCPVCYKDAVGGVACDGCRKETDLHSHIAMSKYVEGTLLSECVHALKYAYREQIMYRFESQIQQFVMQYKTYFGTVECVIPVPLHGRRYAERGFNQAALIGAMVADALAVPYLDTVLKRNVYTSQQAKLSKEKRLENISDAFVSQEDIPYKTVLLVDDVFTTGSTLGACANVLKDHGVKQVQGFSLARGVMEIKNR